MPTHISRDEWLKALTDAGVEDDQGATTAGEFAALFGLNRLTAERRLKALEAAGKVTRTHKRSARTDGRIVTCVAYRLVTETRKKGRAR